ncbi:MAG: LysR family transcriptional regulator [Amphritea sp.]
MTVVHNMDIAALRSFVLSDNLGSFSAAALALHCSQSALSLRIKKLEEQLGSDLFYRNYHNLRLTAQGKLLLPEAISILNSHDKMLAIARHKDEMEAIRLGLPEDLTTRFFHNFLVNQPQFVDQIELSMHLCRDLIQLIDDDKLDIAIVNAMPDFQGGFTLTSRDLKWVCSPTFNFQPNQPLPLALHPEGCIYREHTFKVLNALGIPYRIVFSAQGTVSVQAAVIAGMGLSVTSQGNIPSELMVVPDEWGLPALGQTDIRIFQNEKSSASLDSFASILRRELPTVM